MAKRVLEAVTLAPAGGPTETSVASYQTQAPRKDHFIRREGRIYAGEHIIVDFHGARRLDDLELMDRALREAVARSGATLLHIHLHHFTPNGGISGVAVLAESHISVHTWPERGFAAFDCFMCGNARPDLAVQVLREHFQPLRELITRNFRGSVESDERLC